MDEGPKNSYFKCRETIPIDAARTTSTSSTFTSSTSAHSASTTTPLDFSTRSLQRSNVHTTVPSSHSTNATRHATKTDTTEADLSSTTSSSYAMTISSATATSSSQHMAFSGRRPALIAVILGATFGAVLICVIISLSLCYWRRIRRKRILLPYPFLQKSMKSPSDMAHSEGAFAKSRIVRESPLPDRFSKDEQSRVSQDNTVVNPDSNDQEAVELGLENERLRQENEFLRLMTHQASKPTKGGPLHGSTLLSRTKECRVS